MIFLKVRNTSITTRMLALAILPVLLMSGFIFIWSYYSRSEEIRHDLNDRGAYLAEAIAESSQYGLISGNADDIKKVIQRFLAFDQSIIRIEVFDRDKNSIALISRNSSYTRERQISGAEIRNVPLDIGVLFVEGSTPHVTSKDYASSANHGSIASFPENEVIGYVKVTMSPANLLSNKRNRLLLGLAISVICLLASVLFGLLLARGFTEPLSAMISTLRRIRSGDYDVKLDGDVAGNEIRELQVTIVEMAKSLAELTKNLEERVSERTQDLQAARDEAIKSDAEKRRLLYKVNSVVEEERKNIAIEIHDHLNSSLIVAKLESKRILTLLAGQSKCQVIEEVADSANSIVKLTSELYEFTRDIVKRLRPETIDTLGLRDAVEEIVRYFDSVHSECRFDFHSTGNFSELEGYVAISAYRLVQEALSNIIKHSRATRASVELVMPEEKRKLFILIIDNGTGFDPAAIQSGIGLIGMKERVHGLGGQLTIRSNKNDGTQIDVVLPIQKEELAILGAPTALPISY